MSDFRKRRQRRREKAKLKNPKAVRAHKKFGGRTGGIWHKRTPSSRCFALKRIILDGMDVNTYSLGCAHINEYGGPAVQD